ncbi:uncharacterized protein [Diadema setosum]|uniref:uncharacterized protein n=1 Tax=Diadema setosum TaxID=31175 RepID=UPI003B3A4EB5
MDEPMESVEKGAVIAISIAGGIVIVVLAAVVFYIFYELYCRKYYGRHEDEEKESRKRSARSRRRRPRTANQTMPSADSMQAPERALPGSLKVALPPEDTSVSITPPYGNGNI